MPSKAPPLVVRAAGTFASPDSGQLLAPSLHARIERPTSVGQRSFSPLKCLSLTLVLAVFRYDPYQTTIVPSGWFSEGLVADMKYYFGQRAPSASTTLSPEGERAAIRMYDPLAWRLVGSHLAVLRAQATVEAQALEEAWAALGVRTASGAAAKASILGGLRRKASASALRALSLDLLRDELFCDAEGVEAEEEAWALRGSFCGGVSRLQSLSAALQLECALLELDAEEVDAAWVRRNAFAYA